MSDPRISDRLKASSPELDGGACKICKMQYMEPVELAILPPNPDAEFNVMIGMPTSKIWVWQQEMDSYASTIMNLKIAFPKINILKANASGLCVSAVRNQIVKHFLNTDAKYLIFLDYDMVFHPDLLSTIVTALQDPKVDVYGGIYHAN